MSDLETLKAQHPEWCWSYKELSDLLDGAHYAAILQVQVQRAALVTLVQQHEATIAELERQLEEAKAEAADWLKGADKWSKDTFMLMRERNEAQSERDAATREELRKAEETIQQQARKLEEADEALVSMGAHLKGAVPTEWFEDSWDSQAYDAALARQSARSQQAEAKEEK